MIFCAAVMFAALAVAPADRLALADRLFSRGMYREARAEYSALDGEKSLREDDLAYRLGECCRMLGDKQAARSAFKRIISKFPASPHADRARLLCALSGTEDEQKAELGLLDTDRVEAGVRASALYHLGVLTGSADALERCLRLDPKGRLAPYAKLRLSDLMLASSSDPSVRRKAVSIMLEVAFGGGGELAEDALYRAAAATYADRRHSESATLLRRYIKTYPAGRYAKEAVRLCAWSDYLSGRYADAAAMCGDGADDDTAFLLAACANARGERARAAGLYGAYLERFPQGLRRGEAELALARLGFSAAEERGDAAAALECARRAASLSGQASDRLRLAWSLGRSGQVAAAAGEYMAVARDFPGTPDAADAMFRKAMDDLREERWAAADLALSEALAGALDGRRVAEAEYWRGMSHMRLGHPEEGLEHLKTAIAKGLSPDLSREARLMAADCDYNAGRIDAAKAAYARLVREGAAVRMSAAKALAVGRLLLPGEEAAACAKVLAGSDSAEWRQAGYALLGEAGEAAGSFSAAIDAYRRCLAEDCVTEDLPKAAARLGALEAASGQWDAAETTLKRAVELNVSDAGARAESYLHLAEVAAAKGDVRGARGYATVVVNLYDEGTPFAKKAEALLKELPEGVK